MVATSRTKTMFHQWLTGVTSSKWQTLPRPQPQPAPPPIPPPPTWARGKKASSCKCYPVSSRVYQSLPVVSSKKKLCKYQMLWNFRPQTAATAPGRCQGLFSGPKGFMCPPVRLLPRRCEVWKASNKDGKRLTCPRANHCHFNHTTDRENSCFWLLKQQSGT